MPAELLCGRVANASFKVDALQSYYRQFVEPSPATHYHDNDAAYEGWAITSRDGTTADGVQRIDRQVVKQTGDKRRGTVPTPLCRGYIVKVIEELMSLGLKPHRIRIMRLAHEGVAMKWHRDADSESWRLHIPIFTNENSFFEWRLPDDSERRLHLPADGSGWLVRVDELHRAINSHRAGGFRVHLLMSLSGIPLRTHFAEPCLTNS
jgi:hypothetical protein